MGSNQFKVGDKVVCKDSSGYASELTFGCVYTVTKVQPGLCFPQRVWLADVDGSEKGYYASHRFDLYVEGPKFPTLADLAGEQPAEKKSPPDKIDPNHYARFPIQPITFITTNKLEFWQGNIIKYIMRYDAKDGLQDLYKARRYLDEKIAEMEAGEKTNG